MKITTPSTLYALVAALLTNANAAPDILLTDFESDSYGDWKVEGEAFGTGPATGSLPGQMDVSGFEGKRLVNSFIGGDETMGKLTSPPFKIERPFMNFLIGAGGHKGKTCMNLLVDGKVVRTATGPNTQAGSSEALDWASWDVKEFVGKQAVIEIIDQHSGGWGHINIDQITQSDKRRESLPATYTFTAEKRYLHVPVGGGAKKRRLKLLAADGKSVREMDVELAIGGQPSFVAAVDLAPWQGKTLTLHIGKVGDVDKAVASLVQSDELPNSGGIYKEKHRPLFHFTSKIGWLNDPNGLVYHNGEWHLYYQHNPYGWSWGNMHWGHAVSHDLFHWKELGDAIYPWSDCEGAAFSGSAVIDHKNTSGFGKDGKPPLIAALTDTGAGESIAYSNDNGRTMTMYSGNPVVRHSGRDPKIIWHEPTERWVMALYDEFEKKRWIAFHSSPDLKNWEFHSRLEGYYECADIFELPVDGDANNTRWIVYAADAKYAVGKFDGKAFTPEHEGKRQLWHGNFYASQTYDNAPDGRRVQIGWGRGITFPGMPFNQQMGVPVDLSLHATPDGIRMHANPVKEIEGLRKSSELLPNFVLADGDQSLGVAAEALDVAARIRPKGCKTVGLILRGRAVTYDTDKSTLTIGNQNVTIPLKDGTLDLRILIDRGSIEIFANRGGVAIASGGILKTDDRTLSAFVTEGSAEFSDLTVHVLRSVWE